MELMGDFRVRGQGGLWLVRNADNMVRSHRPHRVTSPWRRRSTWVLETLRCLYMWRWLRQHRRRTEVRGQVWESDQVGTKSVSSIRVDGGHGDGGPASPW